MEIVLPNFFTNIGEGPYWDHRNGQMSMLDISVDAKQPTKLYRWHIETNEMTTLEIGEKPVTFNIPCSDARYSVISMGTFIYQLDWSNETATMENKRQLAEVHKNEESVRFNDAKCDANGVLYAGSMSDEKSPAVLVRPNAGNLYRYELGKEPKICHSGLNLSNGIDWSGDSSTMFFVDSVGSVIHVFSYDKSSSTIVDKRTNIEFSRNPELNRLVPDGITMDINDKLWIALFFGSCVIQMDPETEKVLQKIEVPGRSAPGTTSCCFAGANLTDLYVTSTGTNFFTDASSGSVFRVPGNVHQCKGRPMNFFQL